jgi:phage terminase large subunit
VLFNPANGARIVFLACDDPNKIKSTEWNDIWMEEANEFTWDDFVVFNTRLSAKPHTLIQVFISLNPDDEQGWPNQRLLLDAAWRVRVKLIRSSYRDNPFLDADYVALLEDLEMQDPTAWQIYGLGLWGKLTHVIYQPYTVLAEFPAAFDEVIYGLDFGFSNPACLLEVGLKERTNAYLRELLYRTQLTNQDLIAEAKRLIPPEHRRRPIYADAAEPDRIEEFYRAGFRGIRPADKEVEPGLDFCKRLRFFTLTSNVNLNKERGIYKYRVDKNGNVLEEPVKFMDHAMDAKRYALWTHHKGRGKLPGIWTAG